jgi:hypothetical protein
LLSLLLLLEEYFCEVEEFSVHYGQYLTTTARVRQEELRIPVYLGFPATFPLQRMSHLGKPVNVGAKRNQNPYLSITL